MYINQSLQRYIKKLSSDSPVPGGGSASALVGALGISLILMVARISLRKLAKKDQKSIQKTIQTLTRALKDVEEVVGLDVKVYKNLMDCYRQSKKPGSNQTVATRKIQAALLNSFRLQADLALLLVMSKAALPQVAQVTKGSIANDLIVAEGFLKAAFQGAVATAKINLAYLKSEKKEHFRHGIEALEKKYYTGK